MKTETDTVIQVDGVVTRFGAQTVHDGVSFSVKRGTLVALIGGSGTGKSVLLREIIGLGKSPVFALFIAVIGCRMGLSVSRDTRSIGINTTSTVVQGIVAVILLDAMFAVIFQELGI